MRDEKAIPCMQDFVWWDEGWDFPWDVLNGGISYPNFCGIVNPVGCPCLSHLTYQKSIRVQILNKHHSPSDMTSQQDFAKSRNTIKSTSQKGLELHRKLEDGKLA